MTLGEDLQRIKTGNQDDPVTEATKKGRMPTLRDVKKSVKVLHVPRFCRYSPLIRLDST